ncbi:MAG: crossover junction endodeoxyribonuclease RuvC [Burkholderiaceae bacterium]|nr:crossover junction endodeoxyribonuclease RuvC [Burkholderiaceae bacterium]
MSNVIRILGIDPGLNFTGYGIIDYLPGRYTRVTSGVLKVPYGELSERLGFIFEQLTQIIDTYKPSVSAIEKTFLNTNAQSSMLLSHARGVAMCAPASRKLCCKEFSTREIKKAVTGTGAADKVQVQSMVARLLNEEESRFSSDESDAIATAICYANSCILVGILPAQKGTGKSATASARKGASAGRSRNAWTQKYEGKLK